MRISRLLKKLDWKIYLLELVIVVLGISIAYQVNVYYENRVSNGLEYTAIQNLAKEIEINLEEFKSLEDYRVEITKNSKSLLDMLRSTKNISLDSANKYVFKLIRTSTPDLQQEAANFYLNSNYSDTNIELKNELLVLKTYIQELLQLSDGYSKRKDERFKQILYDAADFDRFRVVDLSVINSLKFKNIIWDQASDEKELNRLFDQAYDKLKEIKVQIQVILNKNN